MIQPIEMRTPVPMMLHGGVSSTTLEVWEMLTASRRGDVDHVARSIASRPELATCQYNYTPPLYFAVRKGHLALVRMLVEQGAYDPHASTRELVHLVEKLKGQLLLPLVLLRMRTPQTTKPAKPLASRAFIE